MAKEVSANVVVSLGRLLISAGALEQISATDALRALDRHAHGDWGEVGEEDWNANNQALKEETRLFSAYWSMTRERFWIITEADRSSTTILMPEDY